MEAKKCRIVLCGNFANGDLSVVNGQVTKTRNVLSLFLETGHDVVPIDTARGKIKTIFRAIKSFFSCDAFVLCVSRNGTKVLAPLLAGLKRLRKGVKLFFLCIGTCPLPVNYLPNVPLAKKQKKIGKILSFFDAVCPETEVMKEALQKEFGLGNVRVFRNWQIGKRITLSQEKDNGKFVYFSRIAEEKNVLELLEALDLLRSNYGIVISVDFYGPIDPKIEDAFRIKVEENPNLIYRGILDNKKAIEILSRYKALLFTTRCLEGTPGAIVDASFAGLPVISQPFWTSSELLLRPGFGIVNSDIASNILSFLKLSEAEAAAMKNKAIRFAETYADGAASWSSLSFLYQK